MLLLNISVNKPAFSRGVRGRLQHPGQQILTAGPAPALALIRSALCRKHGYPGACRFQQFSVRVHYCTNCIRVRLPIKCTRTCRRGVGPSPVTLSWVESPGSRLFFTRALSCFEWSWPRGARCCCCCCAVILDVYFPSPSSSSTHRPSSVLQSVTSFPVDAGHVTRRFNHISVAVHY